MSIPPVCAWPVFSLDREGLFVTFPVLSSAQLDTHTKSDSSYVVELSLVLQHGQSPITKKEKGKETYESGYRSKIAKKQAIGKRMPSKEENEIQVSGGYSFTKGERQFGVKK